VTPDVAGGALLRAGARPAAERPISVDVGEGTVSSTILREGREVRSPELNPRKVEDLLARTVVINRNRVPRIVAQSIPAGTRVPRGTPVDLVLLPVSDIDFSLFDRVHEDFQRRRVEEILPILADPQVEPLLDKARPEDLSEAERATITAKLAPLGITVDDATPAKSFATAFETLQSTRAFQ